MDKENGNLQFDSKIRKRGASYYLLIPPQLKTYLSLRHGSNVTLQVEEGDYGPYISFWNPSQQSQEGEEGGE